MSHVGETRGCVPVMQQLRYITFFVLPQRINQSHATAALPILYPYALGKVPFALPYTLSSHGSNDHESKEASARATESHRQFHLTILASGLRLDIYYSGAIRD